MSIIKNDEDFDYKKDLIFYNEENIERLIETIDKMGEDLIAKDKQAVTASNKFSAAVSGTRFSVLQPSPYKSQADSIYAACDEVKTLIFEIIEAIDDYNNGNGISDEHQQVIDNLIAMSKSENNDVSEGFSEFTDETIPELENEAQGNNMDAPAEAVLTTNEKLDLSDEYDNFENHHVEASEYTGTDSERFSVISSGIEANGNSNDFRENEYNMQSNDDDDAKKLEVTE